MVFIFGISEAEFIKPISGQIFKIPFSLTFFNVYLQNIYYLYIYIYIGISINIDSIN